MEDSQRVALVTGGSRRLGKAITQSLAGLGCRLIVHYGRSSAEAKHTVDELREQGADAHRIGADLSRPAEIDRLFAEVTERFARLDILVNSAASFHRRGLSEVEADDWDRGRVGNLRAPLGCIRAAIPLLRAACEQSGRSSSIINIADLSGVSPWPGYGLHGASKAGLLQLTVTAARELAPEIRVNSVVPGPVLPPPGADTDDPDWTDLVARLPIGRRGWPADVGAAVRYLVEADFVVGSTLIVDGGEHLLGAGHREL